MGGTREAEILLIEAQGSAVSFSSDILHVSFLIYGHSYFTSFFLVILTFSLPNGIASDKGYTRI